MIVSPTRRAALFGCLSVLLAGCGDDEAAQRTAFIAFLQTRILDTPGLHVPRPTPEETKNWGDYAQHYAVITGFNGALSQRVSKPMERAASRGSVRSIQDLLDRRSGLAARMNAMNAKAQEVQAAQRRLQTLITGG